MHYGVENRMYESWWEPPPVKQKSWKDLPVMRYDVQFDSDSGDDY